jgi:metal-dependent amidase/aminoacylase/carboxypeptidase family protein
VELGRLNYFSDGMIRGEIQCTIPDKKATFYKFTPNAILILNEVINEIMSLRLTQRPRSRIVIGKISGGANHGKIAYKASLGFEIRSDSYKMVKSIYHNIRDIVAGISHENEVDLSIKTISNLKAAWLKVAPRCWIPWASNRSASRRNRRSPSFSHAKYQP